MACHVVLAVAVASYYSGSSMYTCHAHKLASVPGTHACICCCSLFIFMHRPSPDLTLIPPRTGYTPRPPSLSLSLQELEGAPETVNECPVEKGWFVKIKVSLLVCVCVCVCLCACMFACRYFCILCICVCIWLHAAHDVQCSELCHPCYIICLCVSDEVLSPVL